jgi:hypothetical protein
MHQEAEKLLQDREERFPDNLLEARKILLSQVATGDASEATYEKLCETLFWLGFYSDTKEQKEEYFSDGAEQGKKAAAKFPESAGANFWYAMNTALYSVTKGIMKSLFSAPIIRKHGQKALELNEDYFFGGPLRLTGRSYHKAPGGSLDKAIENLEKAVSKHGDFLHNQIFLADAYLSKGRKADAKKLLDGIVGAREPEHYRKMFHMLQTEAKELLSRI